jgi:hypothetical protein
MSFRNTKTPTRAEIVGKARYQVPTRLVHGLTAFYLTPELEAHFVRLYPTSMNRDMMRLFGISFSTMQRFKRELGLQKKMKTIRHKQAQWAKRICEENGYYDSMRGKAPCEAAMEATRQLRASGWHPMQVVRKNKRRYQRLMQKRSEKRKELMRKERIRVDWGMSQNTNLHIPYDPYGKRRTSFKSTCKRVGYIPGNAHKPSERWIIYYTNETQRGELREKHGVALGFKFEPLKMEA